MSLSAVDPEYDTPQARFAPRPPTPVATYTLIGANVVIFLLEMWWGALRETRTGQYTLAMMGANLGFAFDLREPWRLVSYAFLHASPAHIFMNMYALYILGTGLERLLGASRLLAVYAASAFAGGLLSALFSAHGSVGASGAIWGLMTAELVWLVRLRRRHGRQVVQAGLGQIAQPLLINLMITFVIPNIDIFGHLGGGIAGALLALLFPLQLPGDDRPWRPGAALGVLLMAASVIAALVTGQPWRGRYLN
jgi:rhomboid protease GluP